MQIEDILKVWPSTLPLHSSGKTVNDKPRKRQMWDIGWHRGIPIFRIFTFSDVSGKMRPPDIFISSGATKSHFMKVFKKLRFHVAFVEILMALSQIGNTTGNMENTVHSWWCVKWQLFFPYVPFLSKCLLVSERATLWKISTVTSVCSHPLCDT